MFSLHFELKHFLCLRPDTNRLHLCFDLISAASSNLAKKKKIWVGWTGAVSIEIVILKLFSLLVDMSLILQTNVAKAVRNLRRCIQVTTKIVNSEIRDRQRILNSCAASIPWKIDLSFLLCHFSFFLISFFFSFLSFFFFENWN